AAGAGGTAGASHVEANCEAFCASASHGLLLVLNQEFPPLGLALSCEIVSGALATTGGATSASIGTGAFTISLLFDFPAAGSGGGGIAHEFCTAGTSGIA